MTPQQLADFASEQLQSILHMSGEVLYSESSTLRPGRVYLLGHNPGGDAMSPRLPTVGSSVAELPTKTFNSYLDTTWEGRALLQPRVVWLLKQLGLDPRAVAASNLIFPRSRDAATSQFRTFAELCWPVHLEIMKIVNPALIITYGNSGDSPYSFMLQKFSGPRESQFPSGHGNWSCRAFQVPGSFHVVGLPHMSRYAITSHPEVVGWIRHLTGTLSE